MKCNWHFEQSFHRVNINNNFSLFAQRKVSLKVKRGMIFRTLLVSTKQFWRQWYKVSPKDSFICAGKNQKKKNKPKVGKQIEQLKGKLMATIKAGCRFSINSVFKFDSSFHSSNLTGVKVEFSVAGILIAKEI